MMFNRFVQPDVDLDTLTIRPRMDLSAPFELRLPLRWMAILRGRVAASLAASTGVQSSDDIVKLLLTGADAVMVTSAFLRSGPELARELVEGLATWLESHEYEGVLQMKGSLSQENSPDPSAFERAHYMAALTRYVWEEGW
ncbi:MAG: hypothetical protein HC923_05370 [Myxococcales bacterium]|nr:hypothetical protein [Myxococcales bacterium]